jgi:hypothetical protein
MPVFALLKTLRHAGLLSAALLLLVLPSVRAAEAPGLITLLEGEATLIVGARAFDAVRGARVASGSIIETDAKLNLLRLEWPDGSVLDLGPGTKVLVKPPSMSVRKPPLFYLLQGWAKQTQTSVAAGQLALAVEVAPFKGVLVSHIEDGQETLFSESGGVQVSPRRGGALMNLRAGEAAQLGINSQPQLLTRPAPAWLQRVPRAFRETLPSRLAQATTAEPSLRAKPALSYAGLQPWLAAELALRREFPRRFAELLSDRGFRAAVQAQMAQHPEWHVLLYPPRPASTAARKPDDVRNDTRAPEPKL